MKRSIFSLFLLAALLSSCVKHEPENTADPVGKESLYYTNLFAFNMMQTYYLWKDDIADALKNWTYYDDPKERVLKARMDIDKWTVLTDDYEGYQGNIDGNGSTLGFDFVLYYADNTQKSLVMVVTFTYRDSPAQEAGIRRGDAILRVDSEALTPDNYVDILNRKILRPTTVKLDFADGRQLSLSGKKMYEEPVHTVRTLEAGGRKVGYLHFTSFTMDACKSLEEAFRKFKVDGIEELVLDLRYNGGGYAFTGAALASMIAPLPAVNALDVFTKEVFNDILAKEMNATTNFGISFTNTGIDGKDFTVKPTEVNPEVSRLWVITGRGTASASESLICGLKPYISTTLVGDRTYGKFCGGYLISAVDWYNLIKKDAKDIDFNEALKCVNNWGIYVIASRYADRDGVTLSMPSGIPADIQADDDPLDGYDLGDPGETLLATVLQQISGTSSQIRRRSASPAPAREPIPYHRPGFGVLLY